MTTSQRCAIVAALALAASNLAAQNRDTTTLAPIVVTATRMPASAATLASAVTVLEGDDLARAGIATVSDAVRTLAGVAVAQTGSFGGVTSMFLRGGQSDYVRVLVDGVPMNAPGGALNLANLSTLNVERIELVRGPSSVLYGSDAVSGVMQIFTRHGSAPHASVTVGGGGYGSSDVAAQLATGRPGAGATLALAQQATDGLYDYNNHYRNSTASGSAHLAPDARTDVTLAARYGDALFHYPTDGSGNQFDTNAYATARATTLSLEAGRYLTPRLEGRLLLGYNDQLDRTEDAQNSFHGRAEDERASADARLNAHVRSTSILTVGGSIEEERSSSSYTSSFGPGGGPDAHRTNGAAYAQAMTSWRDRAWLQAGLRLDDNQRFGTFGTWRLGIVTRVATLTRVRVNLGTAFREPAFSENYSTAFTVGNPDLKPERSTSWELGLEQAVPAAHGTIALTYFNQRFRDMIQYTFAPPPPDSANYYNIAAANASGVEIEARFLPIRVLRIAGQYSFVHTSVTDSGYDGAQFKPGSPLIRRPEHSAALTAEFTPLVGLDAGVRVSYTGRREDLDFSQFPAARVSLAPYTRIDLWAAVGLLRPAPGRPTFTATARVDNVANVAYTEIYGFRTPGRMLRIGVRVDAGR